MMSTHLGCVSPLRRSLVLLLLTGISVAGRCVTEAAPPTRTSPLQPVLVSPSEGQHLAGRTITITARVDGAQTASRFLTAVVTYPGGAVTRLALRDDGLHGDAQPQDGLYSGWLTDLTLPGLYRTRLKALDGIREAWGESRAFYFAPSTPFPWLAALCGMLGVGLLIGGVAWLQSRRAMRTLVDVGETVKEYRRARVALEALSESLEEEKGAADALLGELRQALADGKRQDEELTRLRLNLEGIQREVHAWEMLAMEFFDSMQRGIEQYGPEDPRGKALARNADIYARHCEGRGVDRVTAAPGDPLVSDLYQVVGEEVSGEIPADTILRCEEWGYRINGAVVKRARVVLAVMPANEAMEAHV